MDSDDVFEGLVDFGLFADKTPPCFVSKGLASHATPKMKLILSETNSKKIQNILSKIVHSQIRYQTLRDINTPRHLSIPHPESYVLHCLAIKRVWKKIKTHCAQPISAVSRIYVRNIGNHRIFKMNYKGIDRFENQELEIEFQCGASHIVHADISKCFPSMYTHSLAWAIHGKAKAKKNRNDLNLEGNLLDKACQILSDNQTNGIAIGPHSSNIISEIVLTKVDLVIQKKGYINYKRNIDDYTFYAQSYLEAEAFLRELSMALRDFELYLNDKKTLIETVPQMASVDWINKLNSFKFSSSDLRYSEIRSFLDLALSLAKKTGSSAVINYAIQIIPARLNNRAKRMFTAEAINLCLAYPYLSPLMEGHIFEKHRHGQTNLQIEGFVNKLIRVGVEKIYPDSIAFALYYSLKYNIVINLSEDQLREIVTIDDCLTNVLLWEYSKLHTLTKVKKWLKSRADNLKKLEKSDQDVQWLLIYTIWDETTLRGNGQGFLADLKKISFSFINF